MKKMNKWFYAFLAVAVVLVVAVVMIVMMGLNNSTPDPTPDYTEGAETGVYYYDVADGEVVLSLNSGNIFSIAGPGLNKSGTYTVEGDQIALDIVIQIRFHTGLSIRAGEIGHIGQIPG